MDPSLLPKSISHRLPPGSHIFFQKLEPVRQKGPQCGLAALKMAGSFFGAEITVEEIFSRAQAMGMTRNGEILSVEWLVDLGKIIFPKISGISRPFPIFRELQNLLEAGNLVLVAYDCDRNHEPTRKSGHKAHWALIVGFVVSQSNFPGIQAGEGLKHASVLAMHGKSSLLNMWSYEALRDSNEQLQEAGPGRPGDEYRIPSDGIELKGKCVCISRQ